MFASHYSCLRAFKVGSRLSPLCWIGVLRMSTTGTQLAVVIYANTQHGIIFLPTFQCEHTQLGSCHKATFGMLVLSYVKDQWALELLQNASLNICTTS